MKPTLLIAFFAVVFQLSAWAQPCWGDGVQLFSQNDVDNLKSISQGCTSIVGSVSIYGADITNLDSLNWITSIGGNLWISPNAQLTSLQGLSNLTHVGGLVYISGNAALENLAGLNNLQTIGGGLLINDNPQLRNVDGLNSLNSIGADLNIGNNPLLLNVDGLSNLTTVGQTVSIGENNALVSLSGLDNLTRIGGDVFLNAMDNLLSLDGMNSLDTIGGVLYIDRNKNLSSISGFHALDTIGGGLWLGFNEKLSSFRSGGSPVSIGDSVIIVASPLLQEICPLHQPASIKSLMINSTGLGNLDFLQPVIAVERNLMIAGNDSLSELSALNQLETVGRDLWIEVNNLENMNGFQQLKKVGGSMVLRQFDKLTSLAGLEKLDSIGGTFELSCPLVYDLKPLESLKFVGGDLKLLGFDSITTLNGLEGINSIGGTLEVSGATHLPNLKGLDSLKSVGKDLIIYVNKDMTSLDGLENLKSVGGRLSVTYNPVLSDCDAAIICQQLDIASDSIFIESNALGCNSKAEINAHCELLPGQCLPFGIIFDDQADIDQFANNYPGCKEIVGDVAVYGFDITNLDSLNVLIKLGKQLHIEAGKLINLNGLQNITEIGENLKISYSDSLLGLNGLKHLKSIGGTLEINGSNARINNLKGLDSLKMIGKNILIHNNYGIKNLKGIENLDSVGGRFSILNNPVLSDCVVENLCYKLEVAPDSVFIENNAGTCNSPAIVELQCNLPPGQCLSGGITFDSQEKVNRFSSDYPGCTQIMGFVWITGVDITNLDSLIVLTGLENELVIENTLLTNLTGLNNINSIGSSLSIVENSTLSSLTGLEQIKSIFSLAIRGNPTLTSLDGLDSLTSVENLTIEGNSALTDLSSLKNITTISVLSLYYNDALPDLSGLEALTSVSDLYIFNNTSLSSLSSLSNLNTVEGSLEIYDNNALINLTGLDNLTSIGNSLNIGRLPQLNNLAGLGNLVSVGSVFGGSLRIGENSSLTSLAGLDKLSSAQSVEIYDNPALASLSALQNINAQGYLLRILNNDALSDLSGLENFSTFNFLDVQENASLLSLAALENLEILDNIEITNNPALSDCAIFTICNASFNNPSIVNITDNASGCNTPTEVEDLCNSIPVVVEVRLDNNGNCQSDAADMPAANVLIRLDGADQMRLKSADSLGITRFSYLGYEPFSLHLPQFPTSYWNVCQDTILLNPGGSSDTLRATFLLSPLAQCPELTVQLGLPSFFRGCLVSSDLEVSVQNSGASNAEGVKVALVLPPVLELLAAIPPVNAQAGDTLYFDLGEMLPLDQSAVRLTVRTRCDTFLFNQTLCIETFSTLDNPCPSTLPAFSEIKLSADCIGDTIVRFTIKNIGNAPTQGPHMYNIIRNETVVQTESFSLAEQQSQAVDLPADGATYRMEATKSDDGMLTATAKENCGGLTPGLITAFWLDKGSLEYDYDCRQVIGSYDPNQKSAIPTGVSTSYIITANQPIQYTIDFQNTGTDTAYRVLLRDVLPEEFNLNTFRPGFSSHPCTWEIRGNNLDVLFFPIALPDSNVNEPASRGFFSFELDQKPNLPDGTSFQNNAAILFDFNPPIITNTVYHFIGELSVHIEEPQRAANLWQVAGNPTRNTATFNTLTFIGGEKRFELYDLSGRPVRMAKFFGQSFVFQRDGIPAGIYLFRITDEHGRGTSGQILVTD